MYPLCLSLSFELAAASDWDITPTVTQALLSCAGSTQGCKWSKLLLFGASKGPCTTGLHAPMRHTTPSNYIRLDTTTH